MTLDEKAIIASLIQDYAKGHGRLEIILNYIESHIENRGKNDVSDTDTASST